MSFEGKRASEALKTLFLSLNFSIKIHFEKRKTSNEMFYRKVFFPSFFYLITRTLRGQGSVTVKS